MGLRWRFATAINVRRTLRFKRHFNQNLTIRGSAERPDGRIVRISISGLSLNLQTVTENA